MSDGRSRKIGQYELRSVLGKGGMATVWRAYQPSLDREVAIKLMAAQFSDDESFTRRFNQEARSIARLRHPNILSIYEFGEENGQPYIVTELLDGGTLREFMRNRLELKPISRILTQVADALDYAHAQGMVHRDIKPSNILMGTQRVFGDRAVLGDFGIVKLLSSTHMTQTGQGIGTPEYMSPEQASGETLDGRSDEYSLGIVLYELLTGVTPFKADTPLAVLMGHVNRELPDPRTFRPDLAPEIVAILKKSLAKFPQERYNTVGDFAEAFEQAVSGAGQAIGGSSTERPTEAISAQPRATGAQTRQERGSGPVLTSAQAYDYALHQENLGNGQAAFETLTDIYKREPNYRDVATRIKQYQAQNFQYTGQQTLFRNAAVQGRSATQDMPPGAHRNQTQVGPYVPQDATMPKGSIKSGPTSPISDPNAPSQPTLQAYGPPAITPIVAKKSNGRLIAIGAGVAVLVIAAIIAAVVLANNKKDPGPLQADKPTVAASVTTAISPSIGTTATTSNPTASAPTTAPTTAQTSAAPTTPAEKPDPAAADVRKITADIYKADGNLKDGIQRLQTLATSNKNSWLAQRELGRAYYWYVRDKGGQSFLQQAISLNPDDALSHAYLALAFFDKFDDSNALSEATTATSLNPNSAEVQAAFAITLLRTQPSRAITLAQAAVDKEPDNILTNWAAWSSYVTTRQFGTALPYIKKLVDKYPTFASFANGQGDHFLLQSDQANALIWYTNALKIDGDFPYAHTNLAQIAYLFKGDSDTAIKEASAAVKVYDLDPNAHIWLGYAQDAKANSEAARSEFNKALALDRNSAPAYNGLALSYISQANANKANPLFKDFLTQAISQADQAIKLAPSYADAYFQKGFALYLMNKYSEAEAPLKRATELDGRNANYFIVLGYNYVPLQKKDDAKKAAQSALAINPNSQQAKDLLKSVGG